MKAEAIVYTSCTGNTRRYAYMLGKAANLPVLDLKEANLAPNTPVIYLGWLMAGGVKGLKQARKRFDVRAVCAVGMAVPSKEGKEKMAKDNGLDGGVRLFYLRGGYAPKQLPWLYRTMMAVKTKSVLKQPVKTEADRMLRDAFVNGGSWVTEEQLAPVLAWLED